MNPPSKPKRPQFGRIPRRQEEHEPVQLEEEITSDDSFMLGSNATIGNRFWRTFNERPGCIFWTVMIVLVFISLILLIATLALVDQTKRELDDFSSSSPISSGISGADGELEIVKMLLQQRSADTCSPNGLTIDPFQTCVNKCKREFCHELPEGTECTGNHCSALNDDSSYEECENGCTCCAAFSICLRDYGPDQSERCMEDLQSTCNFGDYTYPPNQIDNVCYVTKTTKVCSWAGLGFNSPVPCA